MELHKALRNIVQTDGQDILKEIRLVNILDDINAYQAIPVAKYILKAIITDGYMDKFLLVGNWNNQTEALVHKFSRSTGFMPDAVSTIFRSIAYSLTWIEHVDYTTLKPKECKIIGANSQYSNEILTRIPSTTFVLKGSL